MLDDAKVGSSSSDCKDEIVKKLTFQNLNIITSYLILDAKKSFIQLR